jgi:hypothetical protein
VNLVKAKQFLARAIDFVNAAQTICETSSQGHLPSACLLLGTAMELLERGLNPKTLKIKPYGHDLQALWKEHTSMYAEAELINEEIRLSGDQPDSFDFAVHFDALAYGYGNESDFSLRYHNGQRSFADPFIIGKITERIAIRERMRRQEPR